MLFCPPNPETFSLLFMKILITGGTGFFGSVLKKHLQSSGSSYVNFDVIPDPEDIAAGRFCAGDLTLPQDIDRCFREHGPFDAVCHVAAQLAHDVKSEDYLWKSNVEGTRHLAECAARNGVARFIFTSTNCLWGVPLNRPVKEDDAPHPVEIYGRSKLEAEQILHSFRSQMQIVIFRSPTIIAAGRVGLLGILFDFILENKKIPVVGDGTKPYQFIAASDYAHAISLALSHKLSAVYHIGSDHPTSLEASYRYVIEKAKSSSPIYHLPVWPTIPVLKILHHLKLSPLGPYQYGMIAEEFVFDTSRIKEDLGWSPTQTNGEILWQAFEYYRRSKSELEKNHDLLPAHRRKAAPGIIRLLQWIS
jgi:UDP-glucose 4-epimerase